MSYEHKLAGVANGHGYYDAIGREADAEVAALNARIAELEAMLAENERLRKVVADGIDTIAMHQYPMGDSGVMVVNHTEAEQWVRRALTALKGTR